MSFATDQKNRMIKKWGMRNAESTADKHPSRQAKPPRDLKYRYLVASMTDDPRLIMGAEFIDAMCMADSLSPKRKKVARHQEKNNE